MWVLWLPKITRREENSRNSQQSPLSFDQKWMKEVKETVAQFVKYKRNQIKILDNQERLWYNGSMKGGYKMYDIDDMIFAEDYKIHSTK